MTHTGPPIRVFLANTDVSFSCRIQDFLRVQDFILTASFFHVDIHGQKSLERPIDCQHSPGMENQTMDCMVKFSLPNASATGTYYCIVRGQETCQSNGVFILVRGKASSQIPSRQKEMQSHQQFLCLVFQLHKQNRSTPRKPRPSGVPLC